MRKYTKPQIIFESFSLSQSVAACSFKTSLDGEDKCGYPTKMGIVFVSALTGCTYTEQDGVYNGICYHNPSDYTNLFSS